MAMKTLFYIFSDQCQSILEQLTFGGFIFYRAFKPYFKEECFWLLYECIHFLSFLNTHLY